MGNRIDLKWITQLLTLMQSIDDRVRRVLGKRSDIETSPIPLSHKEMNWLKVMQTTSFVLSLSLTPPRVAIDSSK